MRSRFIRWAVFLLLAFASFTGFTRAAPLAANRMWGVVTNLESDSIANQVQNLAVGWIRLTIYWNEVETAKGIFNWTVPDVEISRAVQKGLSVFVTIHGTPRWANGNRTFEFPPNRSSDWVDFVEEAVYRYRNIQNVKAYGMWNEPNLPEFWRGTRQGYVQKILIPGALAVKRVKHSLLVGGPELSHHWVNQPNWNLRTILESGAQIDVITQHIYSNVSNDPNGFAVFLDQAIRPLHGDKPVWITESGKSSCDKYFGQDLQSLYYIYMLNAQLNRSSWVKKIFPYRMWDPQNSCDAGNGYGLTYGPTAGGVKKAFRTYRDYIRFYTNAMGEGYVF